MIKFVYLDVGGVVLSDFSGTNKWEKLQHDLGVTSQNKHIYDEIWKEHEKRLSIDFDVNKLIPIFKKKMGIKKPEDYSFLMDFVNRFEINKSIWPVIEEMRKSCRIGLLTNMYIGMFEAICQKSLLPDIGWDAVIDSSTIGLQKPDSKIYKFAEERCGCKNQEILFIDNSQINLDAANRFGWQTFLYDSSDLTSSSNKLMEFFKKNV